MIQGQLEKNSSKIVTTEIIDPIKGHYIPACVNLFPPIKNESKKLLS